MLFVFGCSNNPLKSPGIISLYSSGGTANSNAPDIYRTFKKSIYVNGVESYVYIDKIQISATGEKWFTIMDGPTEVKVKKGELIKIGSLTSVPPGEYHGLKIIYEPKVRFTSIRTSSGQNSAIIPVDVTLTKLPFNMSAGINDGDAKWWTHGEEIPTEVIFTSANGMLVPFNIEKDKETFLVCEILTHALDYYGNEAVNNNIGDWQLNIFVRATSYLY